MEMEIGFANKYFTLWAITKKNVTMTDAYGKHWITRIDTEYWYQKNISFDIEKVKQQYPNIRINQDLRGKTASWVDKSLIDLCPNIMKFGKYVGQDLANIVKDDKKYVVWLCKNSDSQNAKFANKLPEMQAHFQKMEMDRENEKSNNEKLFENFLKSGEVTVTPQKNLRIDGDCAYLMIDVDGGVEVNLKFPEGSFKCYEYDGYFYGLPLIKGKGKRIKGKEVTFTYKLDENNNYQVVVLDTKL